MQTIRHLQRAGIDDHKWNRLISGSTNGMVYAHTELLDALATRWDALVLNDYEAVMPLCHRKKYGISYLYQPAFTQQMGVFFRNDISDPTDDFLAAVPAMFRYWDIQLNHSNHPGAITPTLRKNHLLCLHHEFGVMEKKFSRNARRNIQLAEKSGITLAEQLDPAELMAMHKQRFAASSAASEQEYAGLEKLLRSWTSCSMAIVIGAKNSSGKLIASSGYLLFGNRITFIINGNTAESLETGATHFLKREVIRRFAGQHWLMDFEGSDDPDFSRFYEQYGDTIVEMYPRIIHNRLPWFLKPFKRQPILV